MLSTTVVIAPKGHHRRALSPIDLGFGDLFAHMADAVIVADVASEQIVFWNAHELGNTLAGLIGQVQLLRRDPRLPDDMVARADVIVEKAYEAAAKVARLQNLKQLREARWGTAGTTIDLSPLPDNQHG